MPHTEREKRYLAKELAKYVESEKINSIEAIKIYRLARYCSLRHAFKMIRKATGKIHCTVINETTTNWSFLPVDTLVLVLFTDMPDSYLITQMVDNTHAIIIRTKNATQFNRGEVIRLNFFDMKKTKRKHCQYKTLYTHDY